MSCEPVRGLARTSVQRRAAAAEPSAASTAAGRLGAWESALAGSPRAVAQRRTAAAAIGPGAAGVLQGFFTGPPVVFVALVHEFVAAKFAHHLQEFEVLAGSEQPVSLYDWLADRLGVHTHDVYDWDEARRAPQAVSPEIEMALDEPQLLPTLPPQLPARVEPRTEERMTVEPPPQVDAAPLAILLKSAFENAGITLKYMKNSAVLNFLLDFGAAELAQMTLDARVQNLPTYLQKPLAYTSCHRTAQKLFERMGVADAQAGGFVGKDKGEAATAVGAGWMAAASSGLAQAVGGDLAGRQRTIYEVHCGGHGFAVIMRDGRVEILQSFANAVSLVDRMIRGPLLLDGDALALAAADLASDQVERRNRVAQLIADCDADVFGLAPHPNYQYRWRRTLLRSDADLVDGFRADTRLTFQQVRKTLQGL